ncbi:MAG: Rrf2 family transcriptional regulator [Candidatus Omnitrophica bacterium CG23_combo_of_CG06-09_8_20_14_all_40_11]|nr:MAG: Rrf2 family transcriptional regulator [Candidatus Omnitrophica bacterium CG23_combo_of_CG06-09_8_20_14_all_40_11]
MHITYKGDYALKAILDLSLHYGELVTIHDLAKHADIPLKFLEQVLLDLKRGGFVESRRGKVGGYLLVKSPLQIKLGDVVRFIDGPIEPLACIERNYSGCKDIYKCIFRNIWREVTRCTSNIIDNITFEDLAKQVKSQKETIVYQI